MTLYDEHGKEITVKQAAKILGHSLRDEMNPYPFGTFHHDYWILGWDIREFQDEIYKIISPPMIRFMDWLKKVLERIYDHVNNQR
jgi:hypothetical protein